VWAYFIFAELFTEAQLIGSLILLGSVVLLRVGDRRGPEPVPA
jgi:drug/metabolite transporter (DMT)-like permease